MKEKNYVQTSNSEEEDNQFTGMPHAKPFPDFEPKQCAEKQVTQFRNSTESRENPNAKKELE